MNRFKVLIERKHHDPLTHLRVNVRKQSGYLDAGDAGNFAAQIVFALRNQVLAHTSDHFNAIGVLGQLPFSLGEDSPQPHDH